MLLCTQAGSVSFKGQCSGSYRYSTPCPTPALLEPDQHHGTPTHTPLSTSIVPKTASSFLSSYHHPPLSPGAIVQKNRHQTPLCSLPPVWHDHSSSLSMKTAGYVLLSSCVGPVCSWDTVESSSTSTEAADLIEGLEGIRSPCWPAIPQSVAFLRRQQLEWLLCSSYIVATLMSPLCFWGSLVLG